MTLVRRILIILALFLIPTPSSAADFHGFNPATYDGLMLAPEVLRAMAAEAA